MDDTMLEASVETTPRGRLDPRLDTRAWLGERIDGRIAAGVGIAWFFAYEIAGALEPVTHKPEPWYGVVLMTVFYALLAGVVTGMVMQRRWGLVTSLAAGGFFTALSVACPVSGHHPFGAWWFGQMACALGMVALSVLALHWSDELPTWFPSARGDSAPGATSVESDRA